MNKTFLDYINLVDEGQRTEPPAAAQPDAQSAATAQPKFVSGSTQILTKYRGLRGLVQQVADFQKDWIEFEKQIGLVLTNAGQAGFGLSRQHTGMKKSMQQLQAEAQEWKSNYDQLKTEFETRLQKANETINHYQDQLKSASSLGEETKSALTVLRTEMNQQLHEKHQDFLRADQEAKKLQAKLERLFSQGQQDTTEADQIMEKLNDELAASQRRYVELDAAHKSLMAAFTRIMKSQEATPRFVPQDSEREVAHTTHSGSLFKEYVNQRDKSLLS